MFRLIASSPMGPLTLTATETHITSLRFGKHGTNRPNAILKKCEGQLQEYFEGKRQDFDIPMQQDRTSFQEKVLRAIAAIPYGRTRGYAALARSIGRPATARALANACGSNELPILIPCHRVVAAAGVGGYNGGVQRKLRLLKIEGSDEASFG